MTILETARLRLREMEQTDFDALCAMLCDPAVMYAYEHAFSPEEAHAWLDTRLRQYRDWGFSLWAVLDKAGGRMIGQCGLTWQDAGGDRLLEVGYLFCRDAWGQGYAAEAACACRDYAFNRLGAQTVCAIIRDNNLSSQRVAIRCGMLPRRRLVKHYYGMDMPHIVFTVTRTGQS